MPATSAVQMFASCPALETIYATSFSNTGLSASFMFNGCNRLVGGTDWFVPSTTSGVSSSQCFYSCSTNLVGGNGTVWSSSKTAYSYFRIDTASTPGYITAA